MCVCARRVYRLPVPPTPSHTGPKHAILGRQRPGIDKNAHRISHSLSLCVLSTKLKQAAVAVDTTALGPPGNGGPGNSGKLHRKGQGFEEPLPVETALAPSHAVWGREAGPCHPLCAEIHPRGGRSCHAPISGRQKPVGSFTHFLPSSYPSSPRRR